LVFDNYTLTHPSDALPTSSCSKKISADVEFIEDSSGMDPAHDLKELRQQLQSMKKQALVIMEQSRKSSEREKVALQQAQEAIASKEAAVAEATQATSRENFMLELMTEASLEMAGILSRAETPFVPCLFFSSNWCVVAK
jgi:F0F1-type ATP synthase membrane subunit b/b'